MEAKYSHIPKLSSNNYHIWVPSVERTLRAARAWKIVTGEEQPPPAVPDNATRPQQKYYKDDLNDYERRYETAIMIIYHSCSPSVQPIIRDIKEPQPVWKKLKQHLDTSTNENGALHLRRLLLREQYDGKGSISEYLSRLYSIRDQLAHTTEPLSDTELSSYILEGLPESWSTIKTIIENQSAATRTVDSIVNTLTNHENGKVRHQDSQPGNDNTASNALTATTNTSNRPPRGYGGRRGRGGRGGSRGGTGGGRVEKSRTICWYCSKEGHRMSDCHTKKNAEEKYGVTVSIKRGKKDDAEAHTAMAPRSSIAAADNWNAGPEAMERIFESNMADAQGVAIAASDWIIDSGATDHMCTSKAHFNTMRPLKSPIPVRMGNGTISQATAIGMIDLPMASGRRLRLTGVLWVPSITHNLIAVDKLNYEVRFNSSRRGACTIRDKAGRTIVSILSEKGLFRLRTPKMLHTAKVAFAAMATTKPATARQWHERLGHLNMADVKRLSKLADGMAIAETPTAETGNNTTICKPCFDGKQHRTFNRTPSTRATERLELIHSDLCGPFTPSIARSRYFIIYIDDYSRMTWIRFLKTKSADKACDTFLELKAAIENASRCRIRRFRCDNGRGEYSNAQFRSILAKNGISFEPSAPYTQNQNGVSERKIRTITERARSMLSDARLPYRYWAETADTAVYLINRSPTASLEDKTPYEAWYGHRLDNSHLQRFGCDAHLVLPPVKRMAKMHPNSRCCIMIGYVHNAAHSTVKLWKLWDPVQRGIIHASNIIFDENSNAAARMLAGDELPLGLSVENALFQPLQKLEAAAGSAQPGTAYHSTGPQHMAQLEHVAQREAPEVTQRETAKGGAQLQDMAHMEHIPQDVAPTESTGQAELEHIAQSENTARSRSIIEPSAQACAEETSIQGGRANMGTMTLRALPLKQSWKRRAMLAAREPCKYAEPTSYREAMEGPERVNWQKAIDEELFSLEKNNTWSLTRLPPGRRAIASKWVFKKKINANGTIRYKARLVIKGCQQRAGIDFEETFAPVAMLKTVRVLLALAAFYDWEVHHVDVVTAFLNPTLKEEVYMEQPEGLGGEHDRLVCRLLKALYGLKQAPRAWHGDINTFLLSIGFMNSKADPNLYLSPEVLLILYVDDILIFARSITALKGAKSQLFTKYAMTDLGEIRQFLGLQIERDRLARKIHIHQTAYLNRVLNRFDMANCNGVTTPMESGNDLRVVEPGTANPAPCDQQQYQSEIGSIMYSMIGSRPDLAYTMSALSRFNANPTTSHQGAAKRVLRYIRSTTNYGICYGCREQAQGQEQYPTLLGFADSDWAGDKDYRKSTTGYTFILNGGAVSWKSGRQQSVALSSTEAEYVAYTEAAKEAIWLRRLLVETDIQRPFNTNNTSKWGQTPITIRIDNSGAFELAHNPKHHERTKHIDIRHHFIRETVERELVRLVRIPTYEQTADILTKPLTKALFEPCRLGMGIGPIPGHNGPEGPQGSTLPAPP